MKKNISSPMRATIVMGAAFGLAFIPIMKTLNLFFPGSSALFLTLWGYLAVYSIYLVRSVKASYFQAFFPLLTPLAVFFFEKAFWPSALLLPLILSWIRTGVCSSRPGLMKLVIEGALSGGGALFVYGFSPSSHVGWALGVWLFFLIQSLYFVFLDFKSVRPDLAVDGFETTRKNAEEILTELETGAF